MKEQGIYFGKNTLVGSVCWHIMVCSKVMGDWQYLHERVGMEGYMDISMETECFRDQFLLSSLVCILSITPEALQILVVHIIYEYQQRRTQDEYRKSFSPLRRGDSFLKISWMILKCKSLFFLWSVMIPIVSISVVLNLLCNILRESVEQKP